MVSLMKLTGAGLVFFGSVTGKDNAIVHGLLMVILGVLFRIEDAVKKGARTNGR